MPHQQSKAGPNTPLWAVYHRQACTQPTSKLVHKQTQPPASECTSIAAKGDHQPL